MSRKGSFKLNEWNIQSRARACGGCARPFADQEPTHTVLLDEANAYQRQDLCAACWQAKSAVDAPAWVSHWQGVHRLPPPPAELIQKQTAESLLRKLVATQDARWREASYILAVMLERKRVLKVREQAREAGGRVFIYEHSGDGDVFTIPDPQLQLEALGQVQVDVSALLEHGLPVEGQPWPPMPAGAPAQPVVAGA